MPIRRVGIIDSDSLIDDLIAHVRQPALGSLFSQPLGSIHWIASSHVYSEMYRPDALGNRHKFDKVAGQSVGEAWQTTADNLRRRFEDSYLPAIRFVDMHDVFADHPMALAVAARDVKDKPTGQLAVLMEVTDFLVFSRDRSLKDPGLAPLEIGPVIASAKALGLADAVLPSTVVVGNLTVMLLGGTVDSASKHLRVPKPVGLALIAVLIGWVLVKQDRRAMIGRGFGVAMSAFTQLLALGEAARLELEAAFIEAYESPAIESHIARSLALARGPLLVREIREEFIRVGQPDPTPSAKTILSRLGELPCFVKVGAHRWQLGEIRRPPA